MPSLGCNHIHSYMKKLLAKADNNDWEKDKDEPLASITEEYMTEAITKLEANKIEVELGRFIRYEDEQPKQMQEKIKRRRFRRTFFLVIPVTIVLIICTFMVCFFFSPRWPNIRVLGAPRHQTQSTRIELVQSEGYELLSVATELELEVTSPNWLKTDLSNITVELFCPDHSSIGSGLILVGKGFLHAQTLQAHATTRFNLPVILTYNITTVTSPSTWAYNDLLTICGLNGDHDGVSVSSLAAHLVTKFNAANGALCLHNLSWEGKFSFECPIPMKYRDKLPVLKEKPTYLGQTLHYYLNLFRSHNFTDSLIL
ncbi:uncharacterized protein VTP21DRAFT_10082 [Calcarisporiella thermophila]|uniref:uncharacterized protein n=1 Tax=Calcarisporiella thermophila TaxID=911321 RepID=UPI003743305E